jgi:hypothetical protein
MEDRTPLQQGSELHPVAASLSQSLSASFLQSAVPSLNATGAPLESQVRQQLRNMPSTASPHSPTNETKEDTKVVPIPPSSPQLKPRSAAFVMPLSLLPQAALYSLRHASFQSGNSVAPTAVCQHTSSRSLFRSYEPLDALVGAAGIPPALALFSLAARNAQYPLSPVIKGPRSGHSPNSVARCAADTKDLLVVRGQSAYFQSVPMNYKGSLPAQPPAGLLGGRTHTAAATVLLSAALASVRTPHRSQSVSSFLTVNGLNLIPSPPPAAAFVISAPLRFVSLVSACWHASTPGEQASLHVAVEHIAGQFRVALLKTHQTNCISSDPFIAKEDDSFQVSAFTYTSHLTVAGLVSYAMWFPVMLVSLCPSFLVLSL